MLKDQLPSQTTPAPDSRPGDSFDLNPFHHLNDPEVRTQLVHEMRTRTKNVLNQLEPFYRRLLAPDEVMIHDQFIVRPSNADDWFRSVLNRVSTLAMMTIVGTEALSQDLVLAAQLRDTNIRSARVKRVEAHPAYKDSEFVNVLSVACFTSDIVAGASKLPEDVDTTQWLRGQLAGKICSYGLQEDDLHNVRIPELTGLVGQVRQLPHTRSAKELLRWMIVNRLQELKDFETARHVREFGAMYETALWQEYFALFTEAKKTRTLN